MFLQRTDGTLEKIAFGESNAASGSAGADVEEDIRKGKHEEQLPWFVREGIRIISDDPRYTSPHITINIVCPTGKKIPIFNLPMVVNEDGEINPASLITLADGRTRPRQGCFVEIRSDEAAY